MNESDSAFVATQRAARGCAHTRALGANAHLCGNVASGMEIGAHTAVVNGWAVLPLAPRKKTPLNATGHAGASRSHEQVEVWWRNFPHANVGIATGVASGLLVVNIDGDGGEASLKRHKSMPHTVRVKTFRGHHYYFGLPKGFEAGASSARLGAQFEVLANGRHVAAPPSVHPEGGAYTWHTGCAPDEIDVAPAPDSILAALSSVAGAPCNPLGESRTRGLRDAIASVEELWRFRSWFRRVESGLGNDGLQKKTAYRIAMRGLEVMPVAQLRAVLGGWNTANQPRLPQAQLDAVIESAVSKAQRMADA